jgi:hypothetical protein
MLRHSFVLRDSSMTPEHPVPPPAGQQHLPGELTGTFPVPAVDALTVA